MLITEPGDLPLTWYRNVNSGLRGINRTVNNDLYRVFLMPFIMSKRHLLLIKQDIKLLHLYLFCIKSKEEIL